jgi:hypothetical protein
MTMLIGWTLVLKVLDARTQRVAGMREMVGTRCARAPAVGVVSGLFVTVSACLSGCGSLGATAPSPA